MLNDLGLQIKEALFNRGASLVGFGNLAEIQEDARHSMKSGISIAVALDASTIGEIRNGPTPKYYSEYRTANAFLSELGKYCADMLRDLGHEAISKRPTGVGIDASTQTTALPHKTVATRAGLGWIGKCALLITEEYGSAIRITSVLTDAELETATPINHSLCDDCMNCIQSCPGRAPSGKDWAAGLNRESFFDAFACAKAARQQALAGIGVDDTICGICISVCPWTVKYVEKNRLQGTVDFI